LTNHHHVQTAVALKQAGDDVQKDIRPFSDFQPAHRQQSYSILGPTAPKFTGPIRDTMIQDVRIARRTILSGYLGQ